MITYPLILTIFTVAMISIVGAPKNKTDKSVDELVNAVTVDKSKNIDSRFISDDFDEFHTAEVAVTQSEIYIVEVLGITTKPKTQNHPQKSANFKHSNFQDVKLISSSDLETENIAADITFNFNQPTKTAPSLTNKTTKRV